ncbi:hypothetical protein Q7O_001856 [Pectobacterium carotovorum subsp. carotovorum PCCS1]|nr:hypothetical protein [Pectobacterium carotovorum subsp. carotovorum PCCS1]
MSDIFSIVCFYLLFIRVFSGNPFPLLLKCPLLAICYSYFNDIASQPFTYLS